MSSHLKEHVFVLIRSLYGTSVFHTCNFPDGDLRKTGKPTKSGSAILSDPPVSASFVDQSFRHSILFAVFNIRKYWPSGSHPYERASKSPGWPASRVLFLSFVRGLKDWFWCLFISVQFFQAFSVYFQILPFSVFLQQYLTVSWYILFPSQWPVGRISVGSIGNFKWSEGKSTARGRLLMLFRKAVIKRCCHSHPAA